MHRRWGMEGTLAHATQGIIQSDLHRSEDATNPLHGRLPPTLSSPWAWFAAFSAASFLLNNQLFLDSRYTELATHGFIGACAVLAGRFSARRFASMAIRLASSARSAAGHAQVAVVALTIIGAVLGALAGFQTATLYTRELLIAGANRTAMQERQREWLEEKTRTNLIRPDQPYRLGRPNYQYIDLLMTPAP